MTTHTNAAWTTVAGAADFLGVHEITIRRWIASGRLSAHRVGPRLIRIRFTDLESFITHAFA